MKTIIYLRTSTEEQNPENQLKDCKELAVKLNINDYEVLEEQKSAYKDNVIRPIFESILKRVQRQEVSNLIVWDYDRLFRNRIKVVDFIRNYSKLGLVVYSYRQQWFQEIKKIPSPWNEMMSDLLLQVIGWMAEDESKKRSERIKASVRDDDGITKSRKGNKWGRRKKPVNVDYILELYKQGLSTYEIAKKYSEDNRFKSKISHQTVYNIIKKNQSL